MDYCFVQSANAGISLTTPFCRIWVDALHNQKTMSWSVVSPEIWQKLSTDCNTSCPDFITNTHKHPDHYSQELNNQALETFRSSKILDKNFYTQKYSVEFIKTVHEGKIYEEYPHNCILYKDEYSKVLFAGDTRVADGDFINLIKSEKPDVIVLPFPWITTPRGKRAITENFENTKIIINHIPFKEDDTQNYRTAVESAVHSLKEEISIQAMLEPLQKINFCF